MFLHITARKESAKEKQLKEEEKILESVAEGRGKTTMLSRIINQIYLDKLTVCGECSKLENKF